tara:strand:- start:386 stop:700 length:315 start_codon:yes stop_codon:yes gene_type:complete
LGFRGGSLDPKTTRSANIGILKGLLKMSRACMVTGKKPMQGNNVSHANNKTRRRFSPNIQNHRFWVSSENKYVKLRVSTKGMRIIDKVGIDEVLADIRKKGIQV